MIKEWWKGENGGRLVGNWIKRKKLREVRGKRRIRMRQRNLHNRPSFPLLWNNGESLVVQMDSHCMADFPLFFAWHMTENTEIWRHLRISGEKGINIRRSKVWGAWARGREEEGRRERGKKEDERMNNWRTLNEYMHQARSRELNKRSEVIKSSKYWIS